MTAIDHKQYGGRVKLIKLDIEGYELDALKGAEMTVREFKPVILLKVTLTEQKGMKYLASLENTLPGWRVEQFENMFIAVAD